MTVRRILAFALLLVPLIGSPILAATLDLLAGVAALVAFVGFAAIVVFWPRTAREQEREIHRGMARNLSGADPR